MKFQPNLQIHSGLNLKNSVFNGGVVESMTFRDIDLYDVEVGLKLAQYYPCQPGPSYEQCKQAQLQVPGSSSSSARARSPSNTAGHAHARTRGL
jgi:hypothetical protein